MKYTTPAMQTLLVAIERDCESTRLKEYRQLALIFLDSLSHLVNPRATMTEDQAAVVSNWIVDKHLPRNPDYMSVSERLPLATFINSCAA